MLIDKLFYKTLFKNLFSNSFEVKLWDGEVKKYREIKPPLRPARCRGARRRRERSSPGLVVARFEALARRQETDEVHDLVPASTFGLDLVGIGMIWLRAAASATRGRHGTAANAPSSGSPASSQSSSPPE